MTSGPAGISRDDRLLTPSGGSSSDDRSPGARDRDRILYSLAFRRLASVTQVVAPVEGYLFHNRLTHSLEVAQIGRRLAERFTRLIPASRPHIDPDVVECACLAHDLGHPPFGHAGEGALDKIATDEYKLVDGFEGNAQSFRIVTHLAELNVYCQRGLNLSRASLNAMLKYPWLSSHPSANRPGTHKRKFGAYTTESSQFEWARALGPNGDLQGIEAQVMDLADDIAYSVHDIDDFHRAGLLPLDYLMVDSDPLQQLIEDWQKHDGVAVDKTDIPKLRNLVSLIRNGIRYEGTRSQRAGLRTFTSSQIGRFIGGVTLKPDSQTGWTLEIDPALRLEIDFLKRLVWVYVITNRALANVQAGHRRVIRELVTYFVDAINCQKLDLLPPLFQEDAESLSNGNERSRLAIDIVAGLADDQATRLMRQISGFDFGSFRDGADA
ncbi:MAG TPA: dNTP triphosphohydrolase [Gemmatimonadales bacterium]|nr:dNTP triphosphohydrolase [Gemmatimonadales bacterium]